MSAAAPELVLVSRDGGVATLTINRPDARNALDPQTVAALVAAFEAVERDAGVRCLILTGAGDRAFVAGADIKAMAGMDAAAARIFADAGHHLGDVIEALRLPVIAAVGGFALGAGCELALACDFIYASTTAKMGMPEVGLGVIPGFGGTQRLVRRVGVARARELIFSGAIIDAGEALRIGLANAIVDPADLMPRVRTLAAEIAGRAPLAVSAAKRAIRGVDDGPLGFGLELERRLFSDLFSTADQKEGMRAFADKRQPTWTGR